MNRIDELTLKLLDDEIGDAEFDELREMLDGDREAEHHFCRQLQLEGALRGSRECDLTEATMRRLEERLTERAEHRVMDAVWAADAARSFIAEKTRRRTSARWLAWTFAVATCVLLAVGLYHAGWFGPRDKEQVTDLPQVVSTVGDVQVKTANGALETAGAGLTLRFGETMQISDEETEVVLRYADGTQIELTGTGTLAVIQSPDGGKRLHLLDGLLLADVTPQPADRPLVIETPHADIRVLGTRFKLWTAADRATRLELESGRVELVRGEESPVTVEPNQIALVPVTPDPIQILSRPTVVESPQRDMKLRNVSSIDYAADGRTIIGFGGSHAVYWYEDDRLEAVPVVSGRVGKVRFQGQSGPFVAFEELAHDRLTIWNTRDRRPAHVFEDFARLPRFFTQSRDRNDEYVLPGRKRALSPQGDWAAFEYYGGGFMVWYCESGEWRDLEYRGRASSVAVSPDGRLLALGHWKGISIDLFDMREGKQVDKWPMPEPRSRAPSALCFSADGKTLVLGSRGQVQFFDIATSELRRSFRQSGIKFTRVAVSPDGRFLAASSDDRMVRLWDVNTNSESPICCFRGRARDLKFAPDSRELAALSRYGRVMVWDVPPQGIRSPTAPD